MNLRDMFLDYCVTAPTAIAVRGASRDPGAALTRADLLGSARGAARRLLELGVGRGDSVLISLPNKPSFTTWFWAVQLIGAVAVPVPPVGSGRRRTAQLEYFKKVAWLANPRAVVVAADCVLEPGEMRGLKCVKEDDHPPAEEGSLPAGPSSPRDIALIQFSSGSTGHPKGCVLTHEAVCANARTWVRTFDYRAHESTFNWMPLFHDFGLMVGVIAPVAGGLGSVLLRTESFTADPAAWIRGMSGAGPIHSAGPGAALALVRHRIANPSAVRAFDLRDVRSLIRAAEPIFPDVVHDFMRAMEPQGLRANAFYCAYGMSETTVFASARRGMVLDAVRDIHWSIGSHVTPAKDGEPAIRHVNLGRAAVPGSSFRVVDDRGSPLGERHLGHLQLRSMCLLEGYIESPGAVRTPLQDGWLSTGDVGYLVDGEFHFMGRSKELIVVAGRKIAPADLEHAVSRRLLIVQSRVAAFGHVQEATEAIAIVIESRDTAVDRLIDDARAACFEQCGIAPWKVLVMPIGTIPKTTSGKIQRDALRRSLAELLAPVPMRAAGT